MMYGVYSFGNLLKTTNSLEYACQFAMGLAKADIVDMNTAEVIDQWFGTHWWDE